MKRFLIKLIPFVIFCFLIGVIMPVVIDPYNVFHYADIRFNGIEPNNQFIKMKFILNHPGRFDAYLFGSSRVGFIDVSKISDYQCYNMTYSEGLPKEHLQNVRTLIQHNNIPRLLLIGLDNVSCFVSPEKHEEELLRMPYPQEHLFLFYLKYINSGMVFDSLGTMLHSDENITGYYKNIYRDGTIERQEDVNAVFHDAPAWGEDYELRIEQTIHEIEEIIDLCSQYDIRVIFFTNPIYKTTYQKSVNEGYLEYLKELAEVTEFYNFSGMNDITCNQDYYYETSHFKVEAGDKMLQVIFDNQTDAILLEQGFGVYVTDKNKAEFFRLLEQQ